jgi:hypothetical protein
MAKVALVAQELFPLHPFVPARTLYEKTVINPPTSPVKSTGLRVIKSASSNAKLSDGSNGTFERGPWVGMPLFQVTLEERATCPTTCKHFITCYGSNMPFATRHRHGPELEQALAADLDVLARKAPQGFVVRLHVLGDFYSEEYVRFWATQLKRVPQLRIYGYTHREHGTAIGDAVAALVRLNPGRASILRSDGEDPNDPLPRAMSIDGNAIEPHKLAKVICPEQTGKTASCLTCGLCMNGRTSVSFLAHGKVPATLVNIAKAAQASAGV